MTTSRWDYEQARDLIIATEAGQPVLANAEDWREACLAMVIQVDCLSKPIDHVRDIRERYSMLHAYGEELEAELAELRATPAQFRLDAIRDILNGEKDPE